MLSKDEKHAILEQFTYADSRKVKESRRGKTFAISKALFKKAYFGNTPTERKSLIDLFYLKVGSNEIQNKIDNLMSKNKKKTLKDIHYTL